MCTRFGNKCAGGKNVNAEQCGVKERGWRGAHNHKE